MTQLFCECLNSVTELGRVEEVFEFLQKLLEVLLTALANGWRQVTSVAKCIWHPFSNQPEYVQLAARAGWLSSLLTFVASVYGSSRSTVVLQSLDLSEIFKLLTALLDEGSDASASYCISYAQQILQSNHHSKDFTQLLIELYRREKIELQTLMNTLVSTRESGDSRYQAVVSILIAMEDSQTVEKIVAMMCQKRISKTDPAAFVSKVGLGILDEKLGITSLILRCPVGTLFRFLLDDSVAVHRIGFEIGKNVFRGAGARRQFPVEVSAGGLARITRMFNTLFDHMESLDFKGFPQLTEGSTVSLAHERSRYVFYLRYLKWLIRCLGNEERSVCESVKEFYERMKDAHHDRSDVLRCFSVLKLFPLAFYESSFLGIYDEIMAGLQKPHICKFFRRFSGILSQLTFEQIQAIVRHNSFAVLSEAFPDEAQKPELLEKVSNAFEKFIDDPVILQSLCDLFRAGYSLAVGESRFAYTKLLELIGARLPSYLVESLSAFVMSVLTEASTSKATTHYPFVFDICRILLCASFDLQGFEPDYKAVLASIRQEINVQLEKPLSAVFVELCRRKPREYRESLLSFALECFRTATGHWPRTSIEGLIIKLIVFGDYSDSEVAEKLLVAFAEFVKLQPESTKAKFWEELMPFAGLTSFPNWVKRFVTQAVDSEVLIESFGSLGRGKTFFERAAAQFTDEEAIAFLHRMVETKEPRSPSEWTVVACIFEQFRRLRQTLLDILPVKSRVRTGTHQIQVAFDIIFNDIVPQPPERSQPLATAHEDPFYRRRGCETKGF